MKKMLLAFTSLLLFVPLMMGMSASDTSKDNRVDIVLHKIAFPYGEMPADSENTGRADDDHASLLKEYHGLNNVKFEVFDVSRKFYELRNSGMSAEQAQQELAKLGPNKVRVAEG
ncbi:pilin N-terminal domain-containing protein, partial [Enterococcus canis]